MDQTPNLSLPYIYAAQAQKHVTHNEAIRALDAIVHLSVLDKDLATPPTMPADGSRYIVAAGAGGAWAGLSDKIAAFQDGAWMLYAPIEGWLAWVADEDRLYAFDGSGWLLVTGGGGGSVNPTPLVGVNATADTTNRLSVASPATLLNHEGAGHQLKVNKAGATETASLVFQDAYSGRAEIGLAGDDNLYVKVSGDGATWLDAIVVDRSTGAVAFPFTVFGVTSPNLLINPDFQINQRNFPGGALAAGNYGHDRWKADAGGASYSIAGTAVTLASGTLMQVIETGWIQGTSLASTAVTVSVEAPTADLTVSVGSASATIAAGSGQRSVTLMLGAGDSGNVAFKLKSTFAGSVTFARPKVEVGAAATAWSTPARDLALRQCQRYYWGLGGSAYLSSALGFFFNENEATSFIAYPEPMRAQPTLIVSSPGDWILNNASVSIGCSSISRDGGSNHPLTGARLTFIPSATASGQSGRGCMIRTGSTGNGALAFSAEL